MRKRWIVILISILPQFFLAQPKPELVIQNGHSTAINSLQLSEDSKYLLSIDNLNACVVWDMQSYKQYGSIAAVKSPIVAATISEKGKNIFLLCRDGSLLCYDLTTFELKSGRKIAPELVNVARVNKAIFYFTCGSALYKYNVNEGETKQVYKSEMSSFSSISGNDCLIVLGNISLKKTLVLSFDSLKLIKTINAKTQSVFVSEKNIGGLTKQGNVYAFSVDKTKGNLLLRKELNITSDEFGSKITNATITDSTVVYSTKKGELIKSNLKGIRQWQTTFNSRKITHVYVNKSRPEIFIGFANGDISILDNESGAVIRELKGQINNYYKMKLSSDNESVFCANYSNELSIMSLSPFKNSYSLSLEDYMPESSARLYYIVDSISSFSESKLEFSLIAVKERWFPFVSKSKKNLIIYKCKWDYLRNSFSVELGTRNKMNEAPSMNTLPGLNSQVNKKYGITLSQDKLGMIEIKNEKTDSTLFRFYKKSNEEFIYLKDNYYFGSKASLKSVGYRFDENIYGVETFDVFYNRPDLIFKDCSFIDPEVYLDIVKVVAKRTKGNIPAFLEGDIPQVKMRLMNEDSKFPFERSLQIHFSSKTSPLESINIFVNGSPVKKISSFENGNTGVADVKVELENGKNVINCVAVNKKGISSFNVSSEIVISKELKELPQTYLICLGSAKFEQKDFDLNFPAKDAADIKNKFSKLDKRTKILFFDNEKVTKNCIDSIALFLKDSKPQDKVVLFFAGHGVLNKDLEYYLSAYGIDFNEPEKEGIEFKELERVLANAPARNKILLVDACHSGEIEKEDVVTVVNNPSTKQGNDEVKFRSTKSILLNKNSSPGLLEFSKNLFVNFNNSTGINTISSSSGLEFSMESKEWNNGLFTYCLLNALDFSKSDSNNDSMIDLTEFSNYIKFNVSKISNGKQNPSLRSDNFYKTILVR